MSSSLQFANHHTSAEMGSSAKKKKEKKKDFQKQKLKVGKARPKADNHTNTSFRSKGIVLTQQLDINAPKQSAVFLHQVSLLKSRADSQRRDALGYLTTYLDTSSGASPITINALLSHLCPLILDASAGVRTQLLRLFQFLSENDIQDHVIKVLPYTRAGMTHLSRDIRTTSLDFLSFLIKTAGLQLVSCPGGWHQTLECFTTILGWRPVDAHKWSSTKASFGSDVKSTARVMQVLAEFLRAGLVIDEASPNKSGCLAGGFPLWYTESLLASSQSNAYAHLNLFGIPKDDERQILDDQAARLNNFINHFRSVVVAGIDAAKKEGGELGRAAGLLIKSMEASALSSING